MLTVITGAVLQLLVNDYIVLFSVLFIQFIILIIILLQIFHRYILPIQKASRTMGELVKGNYRARVHTSFNGSVGELSKKINVLARNLSELAFHEQMQAEQLSTVIDNTESGLVLIDEKGYIHLVNRKFLKMFHKTKQDFIGYLYYDVLNKEEIHQVVQETFLYEKNIKGFFTLSHNVDKIYIEVVGAPIFNERNMLKGAVLAFYDITDLKRIEVVRKDFVANVSHELKTPMTSISGFAETLLEEDITDAETRNKFLGIIHDESKRLHLLIDDLLILSKLEKDGFQLNLSTFQMEDLLEEVIPVMKKKSDEKNITLTTNLTKPTTLTADRNKVKQIMFNLLGNAISYTTENGQVKLTVKEKDGQIHIEIQDTGIGIPQHLIPRIFERFYRIDKARSRNTGGTGLGLAIVKHIVEQHKGTIKVNSALDKGTTFTVSLPINRE